MSQYSAQRFRHSSRYQYIQWLGKCKEKIIRTVSSVAYSLRLLRLISYCVNRFKMETREGKLVFPFVTRRKIRNVQILVYHRVNDDRDPFFPATRVNVFAKQMDYLASHFNVLSLEDAVESLKNRDVPDNAVVVTFDDGYRDNYVNAFPILQKLAIPATFLLTTEGISSGKVLWHERVFSAFRETKAFCLRRFGHDSKDYTLRTLEEKLFAQQKILRVLRSLDDSERLLWVARLIDQLEVKDKEEAPDLMLGWDEVRAMHQNGMYFGSHTVTHPILSGLSTDMVRVEIYESKRTIEERLGVPIRTFAYPSGRKIDFNENTKDILKEAGYDCALTMIFGANENGQDLFELRRGKPWEEDLPTFAMKLNWYKFWQQR